KLSDMAVMSLYADNGWIYYQKKSNKNIYRMRTSGTDVMQLTNTVGVDNRIIHMRGDWIYYSGAAGSMQGICKMRTDGSGKKFIVDVEFGGINMDEENIYCNDYGDLYRINEEKKEKIKIGSDIGEAINICGDWIYYTVTDGLRSPLLPYLYNEEEDTSEEFRLSKDGSVKQIIVPGKDGKITDIFRLPAMGFYTPVPIYAPAASSGYTIKTAKEIARQKNAVVSIKVYDEKGNLRASGSGFNIESTGTVVTNFHVIEGASAIKCSFDNGKTYDTDYILNYNYIKDIAILKLKDASGLPVVTLGNSDRVELADDVLAIGNPMDMQNTISDGLISGVRSILGIKYIQTTASISYGSSGGPLFNMSGEVIGVTSMTLMDSQNMNFAVPINSVRKLFHSARCIPIQAVNNYDIEVVEFEDNDSIAKANSLNMDSIIDANLYSSQDKDVFKFELKTDGNVTFTGTFDYHYLDTERIFEIKLLDRNGAVLKESEEILVEETRLQSVTADLKAGTYYVSISGKPVIDSSGKIMPGYTVLCIEN
ncbi:MAG: trypsin-like peptidase domain-containing protein, partial [Bacillota bacterium]